MMVIECSTRCGRHLVEMLPDAGAGFMVVVQHNGVNIGRATVPVESGAGQLATEEFVRMLLEITGIRFTAERVDVTPGVINVITPVCVSKELL